MARKIKRSDDWGRLVGLVIFLWFLALTYLGNLFGQLGLGMLLCVGGIWALARNKDVWTTYKADWKKLPKAQKTIWNEPRDLYYYINLLFLIPLAIAIGLALIFLSYTALV
jgi:hypothetical protein